LLLLQRPEKSTVQEPLRQLLDMLEPLGAQALALVDEPRQMASLTWQEQCPAQWRPRDSVGLAGPGAVPQRGWLLRLAEDGAERHSPHLFIATACQQDRDDPSFVLACHLCRMWWRLQELERGTPAQRSAMHALRNGLNALSMCAQVLSAADLPESVRPFADELVTSVERCVGALDALQPRPQLTLLQ
jgi:hypothetical protein